jgi:hypothetical protein
MTYIYIKKKEDLSIFINTLKIELGNSDYHNCYELSCTKRVINSMTVTMLHNFVLQLIEHITTQLHQQLVPKGNATFYMWFDEQVGHLCFNVLYKRAEQLPFGCRIAYVQDVLPILSLMKQSPIMGGVIPLEEVEFGDFDNEDDLDNYTLLVYKLYL